MGDPRLVSDNDGNIRIELGSERGLWVGYSDVAYFKSSDGREFLGLSEYWDFTGIAGRSMAGVWELGRHYPIAEN